MVPGVSTAPSDPTSVSRDGGKRASRAFFLGCGVLDTAYAFTNRGADCQVPLQQLNEGEVYFPSVCVYIDT